MIEVSEIYVDVNDVYVLCPHCHERQGYWYEDPKGANTVCDQCENDFSVSAVAELQMEGDDSSTNRRLVEKLQADYAAQGLALKAAKAMQAGETERADMAEALRDQLLAALESIAGSKDDPNFGWRGRSKNKDEFACEYCGEASIDCTEIDHRHDCPVPQAFSAIVAAKKVGST